MTTTCPRGFASHVLCACKPRRYVQCSECNRVIVDWERVAHWQTHNRNHPHANCCVAPRDEVNDLFTAVER